MEVQFPTRRFRENRNDDEDGGVQFVRRNELDFLLLYNSRDDCDCEWKFHMKISSHRTPGAGWIQSGEVHEPSNRVQQSVIRSSSQLSTNQFSFSRIAAIVSWAAIPDPIYLGNIIIIVRIELRKMWKMFTTFFPAVLLCSMTDIDDDKSTIFHHFTT